MPLHLTTALIATGDREWDDRAAVVKVFSSLSPRHTLLITGGARGLDALAHDVADEMGFPLDHNIVMPANWDMHHRAAGPIRNQAMLEVLLKTPCDHRLVKAFHDDLANSRGTRDMVRRARKAGIRVQNYRHKDHTRHYCYANSCRTLIPNTLFMCVPHWKMVSPGVKVEIQKLWPRRLEGRIAKWYLMAADLAAQDVEEKEGR